MSLANLTPAARARLVETWKDPDVTARDVVRRFSLSLADVEALKAELGPKARMGPVSRWSINASRKSKRLREQRLAKAVL